MSLSPPDIPTTVNPQGVLSPVLGPEVSVLDRCEAEIAIALSAVLTGALPLAEALLYYHDWCLERELELLFGDTGEPESPCGRHRPAWRPLENLESSRGPEAMQ
jgi:hypothetical protein